MNKQASLLRSQGRFWAGRYRNVKLTNEAAVVACAVFVDLNAVRAGMVPTPEDYYYCSFYHRLKEYQFRKQQQTRGSGGKEEVPGSIGEQVQRGSDDRWLAPIYAVSLAQQEAAAAKGHRASDNAAFGLTIEQYVQLVDQTGRMIRTDKRGSIPAELAPILERIQVEPSLWVKSIDMFEHWAKRVVGTACEMVEAAEQAGRKWFQGIRHCRQLFRADDSGDDPAGNSAD